jgi:hypothetical protein
MTSFSLLLFSTEPEFIAQAVRAGVEGVIVDWENIGKAKRQAFADTQINRDTREDLQRVRAASDAHLICRVNRLGESTPAEVEQAISAGADELLLPMVRSAGEVEQVLNLVDGRVELGILVETLPAIRAIKALNRLPLSRIYVGLMDLAIERGTTNIFTALADGTVESVRRAVTRPFGFGGLTLPDHGRPIPCRLLIGEMARLGCDFSFLRRSFHRDIRGRDLSIEIPRLLEAIERASSRSAETAARERDELLQAIDTLADETLLRSDFDGLAAR